MRAMLVVAIVALLAAAAIATPLDDYVYSDDGQFAFSDTGVTRQGNGWTAYIWNMTSQKWLTEADSSRPIWWHHMAVIVPHYINMTSTTAVMYITGGNNRDPLHFVSDDSEDLIITAELCVKARNVGAVLWDVPNQPITFPSDPWHAGGRVEDSAIALTWWKFMQNTSQPNWILELPMTKSAVKAMDALQVIIPKYTNNPINDFIVAGASKRGWTTWLVGAVEAIRPNNRVRAIVPIVLDALHVKDFFHRQWQYYGAWSFAIHDYYNANITQMVDTPEFTEMMKIVDPWYYRDRLTMPKLAINAVGDEFQMPDDHRYWAHDMPGEMQLIMVKNAEHSMVTGILEVWQSAGAFIEANLAKYPRPHYEWQIDNTTGMITMKTNVAPKAVSVTYADSALGVSAGRRDFRWAAVNVTTGLLKCYIKLFGGCLRPIIWKTTTDHITKVNDLTYTAQMDLPKAGEWRGFVLELQWINPTGPDDFYFTSPTSVIPNTRPFPDCNGVGCRGYLV